MNKPALLALGAALGSMATAGPVLAAGTGNMNDGTSLNQTGGVNTTASASEDGSMDGNGGTEQKDKGANTPRRGLFNNKTRVPTSGLASLYVAPLASYTDDDPERRTGFGVGGSLRIGKVMGKHINTELSLSGTHFFRHSTEGNHWDTFSVGLHSLFFPFRERPIGHGLQVSPFLDLGMEFMRSRAMGPRLGGIWRYKNSPAFTADLGANFRLNNYGVKLRMEGGYQWTFDELRPPQYGGGRYVLAEPQAYIGVEIPLSSQQRPPRQVATAQDSDHDGVPNNRDQCPNTPPGTQVNAKGCPIAQKQKDSDHDGVPDSRDQCPNTPRGEQVLANGCAVKATRTLNQVTFSLSRADLTEESRKALDIEAQRLKKVFKQHPNAHAQINGYADSTGSAAFNKKLSQRRAESVRRYLISKGVSASRLKAQGFGESNPVATNKTRTGRLANRRVVVKVLK